MKIAFYAGPNCPAGTIHDYLQTMQSLKDGNRSALDTTCMAVLDTRLLEQGHTLYIVFPNGRRDELKFGPNAAFGRVLRPEHNLLKLFLAGEFGRKEDMQSEM